MSLEGYCVERAIHDEPPSLVVISAVADATDNDPTEIEPLYSTIDPDALDSLFQTSPAGPRRTGGRVSFSLEGCDIVVHGDRKVVVNPSGADENTERAEGYELRDTS